MFSPAAGPLSEDEQVGGDGTPFPPDDHPRLSLEELRAMLSGETLQAVVMLGESIKSLSKKKSGR
jgi:hypothetical protein